MALTRSALTPVRQAGTRFTYPGEMEGWVGPSGSLYWLPSWFTFLQTIINLSNKHLMATQPGAELMHDLLI